MICKTCGADLPEGAHFCPDCGTPVPLLPDLNPDPEETVKAAPLSDMPEPTAPMYTPAEPEPVYAEPVYAAPVYTEPAAMAPQSEADSILTWGIVGLVCSFILTILGIIFSAIALSKAKRMRNTYGVLPQSARTGRGLAIAGLIVGIVFTVLAIVVLLIVIAAAAYAVNYGAIYY